MTTSRFTWLDYDEEQARRANELIKALSESETVDSIGIGAIRDGIAGLLFPGTSTVQTRVRYFLLVPWALQHVARRRPRDRAQYARFLRETEASTIQQLIDGSPKGTLGIIGSERREGTQRMPSSIYWASIGRWGIRVDRDLSLTGYRDWVLSPQSRELIDGDSGDGLRYLVFDEFPAAPEGFPDVPLTMLPTEDEAGYLLGRMRETRVGGARTESWSQDPGPSLLALVAKDPTLAELPSFWELPDVLLNEDLRIVVHHARLFSLVMQGARLRYVQLLFDAQRRDRLPESSGLAELELLVEEWLGEASAHQAEIAGWNGELTEMFELLARHGVAVGDPTRAFVRSWVAMVVADPARAMSDIRSANLIRTREEDLKKPHHRLGNASALRNWGGSLFGSRPLDYRWGISGQLVRDCRLGIEASHAGA
jgi:hypothetical protein